MFRFRLQRSHVAWSGVGVVTCPSVFMGPLRNTCGRMMRQGEGGGQRDVVVPALLTMGEHNAKPGERVPLSWPTWADHTVSIFANVRREVWVHSRVQIHLVNTQFWKRGVHPAHCQVVSEAARRVDLCRVVERCTIVRGCCSCCARLHGSVICCESSSDPEGWRIVQHVAASATQDVFFLRPWATRTSWEMCLPQFRARLEN